MTARERFVLPLPSHTRDRVDRAVAKIESRELRYSVRRLIEVAYADGYEDGHLAGTREADADRDVTGCSPPPATPPDTLT